MVTMIRMQSSVREPCWHCMLVNSSLHELRFKRDTERTQKGLRGRGGALWICYPLYD